MSFHRNIYHIVGVIALPQAATISQKSSSQWNEAEPWHSFRNRGAGWKHINDRQSNPKRSYVLTHVGRAGSEVDLKPPGLRRVGDAARMRKEKEQAQKKKKTTCFLRWLNWLARKDSLSTPGFHGLATDGYLSDRGLSAHVYRTGWIYVGGSLFWGRGHRR